MTLLGETKLVAMKCFDISVQMDFASKSKNDVFDTGVTVNQGLVMHLGSLHTRQYTN